MDVYWVIIVKRYYELISLNNPTFFFLVSSAGIFPSSPLKNIRIIRI